MNKTGNRARNGLETIVLPLPGGSGLGGLRILHVSDVHARGRAGGALRMLRALEGVECDLVCLTGDIAERAGALAAVGQALLRLSPRLGVFACPGNHDRQLPPGVFEHGLERCGVVLLSNRALRLRLDSIEFNLVGTDDPHRQRHDIGKSFAEVDERLGVLLLTHSPDGVFDLGRRRCDLALSGHTHGGQICPPLLPVPTNTRHRLPAAAGVMLLDGRLCHVSPGLGWSGVPWRWRCPARTHLLELIEDPP